MHWNNLSDDELMLAYAQGEGAAFEALYRRHEGRLFRFVRRVLGAALAAQADEVFQDTWMKIIQARARFAPGQARWTTWAYAIAHNTCLDQLRKTGRELSQHELAGGSNEDVNDDTVLDWLQTRLGDNNPSSEDSAHWRAAGQQLMRCLQQLPDAQRAAFLLHHEDDCSLQEMAAALQIALEAAKSRLRYAMTKLRGCMGAYLEDWPLAGGRT